MACTKLGLFWYEGHMGPKDPARAMEFFEKGCELGEALGCGGVSMLYYLGEGVEADRGKAREYAGKACSKGDSESCHNAAVMWWEEQTEEGVKKAMELYAGACEQKYAPSCYELAVLVKYGGGGTKDHAGAEELAKQACAGGILDGCNMAGWYAFGRGEFKSAAKTFDQACKSEGQEGASTACFNAGTVAMIANKDAAAAAAYYRLACKSGEWAGCVKAAALLWAQDEQEAKKLASAGRKQTAECCEKIGDGECCLALAEWSTAAGEKEQAEKYGKLGTDLLEKECKTGDKGACRLVKP